MESLKDYLAQHAETFREERSQTFRTREEWDAALHRLNARLKGWLEEADPDQKILDIYDHAYPLREVGLGAYEAPGLVIRLGKREIRVEPIARHVAGPFSATGVIQIIRAYGRVDLTDGLRKIMLFRIDREPDDRWSLIEEDSLHLKPLDQASFEEAVKSLLQ